MADSVPSDSSLSSATGTIRLERLHRPTAFVSRGIRFTYLGSFAIALAAVGIDSASQRQLEHIFPGQPAAALRSSRDSVIVIFWPRADDAILELRGAQRADTVVGRWTYGNVWAAPRGGAFRLTYLRR